MTSRQDIASTTESLQTVEVGHCEVTPETTAIVLDVCMGNIHEGQEIFLGLFDPNTDEGMAFMFQPGTGVLVDTINNHFVIGTARPLEVTDFPVKMRLGVEVERMKNGVLHPHVRVGHERLLCPSIMETKEFVAVVGSTYQIEGEMTPASVVDANLTSWKED